MMISADEAIRKLKEGNAQYVSTDTFHADISDTILEHFAKNGQQPYAIVVGCSDSRVIPERIFHAAMGDLFTIRVAGNVIDDHQLGSIEYAAGHLGTNLIVVLGHTQCGAFFEKKGTYLPYETVADVYGLEIKAESIQNNDSNKTRFYVLSAENPSYGMSNRLAFIVSGDASELPGIMAELEKKGIDLVTIHERPEKTELGNYVYIIECANCSHDQIKKVVDGSKLTFRYLGCFEVH